MTEPARPRFGDLDGELVEVLTLRLTGGGRFPRLPAEGERVVLVIEGTVTDRVSFDRIEGELVRTHSVKIQRVAEPTDRLGEEAADFLQTVVDELENRRGLPFPPATEDPDPEEEQP